MITSAQLIEAAELVKNIEAMKTQLATLLAGATDGATAPSATVTATPVLTASGRKQRGPLSPKALRNIRKGQEARWAKINAAKTAANPVTATTVAIPVPAAVVPTVGAAFVPAAKTEQVLANA